MTAQRSRSGNGFFWGLILVVGTLLLVGCGGGGGGGGTPVAPGTPGIALDRNAIDFGNQVIGQPSDRAVTILNTGTANLAMGQIAQADPLNAPFFMSSDTCSGQTLGPNGSCAVVVRFSPTIYNDYSDSFEIPSNAGIQTVNLAGNGRDLKVTITRVDTSAFDEIRMVVSVTDGNNAPVTTLLQGDFTVQEQGNPVGAISVDNTVPNPVSVALVLDQSDSISFADKASIATATKDFLNLLNLPPDEASVIKFDGEVQVMQDFTQNPVALLGAVDSPYSLGKVGTIFFSAVYDSVTMVSERLAVNPSNAGAVIVLSDGRDDGGVSTETLPEVIENGVNSGVLVYTIGFGDRVRSDIMQELAAGTGGNYLPASSALELENVYLAISNIFDNQYEIVFTTLRPLGSVNQLTVFVDDGLNRGDDTVSATY